MLCLLIAPVSPSLPNTPKETIVLVHGMGRSHTSMWVLEVRLRKAGYVLLNYPYGVRDESLEQITERFRKFVAEKVKTNRYHLIGHSLGNIIIRNGFKQGYRPGLDRIVMLAPPNHPPALAKRFKEFFLYRWLYGNSGQQLTSDAFYATLPVPNVEFGVIAGDKSAKLILKEPSDGTVTVESTKLDGMRDFLLLHHSHTFFMNFEDTAAACVRFIQTGSFSADS